MRVARREVIVLVCLFMLGGLALAERYMEVEGAADKDLAPDL